MSSILKALQKVEEEKATRRDGAGGLSSDLLRSGKVVEKRSFLPLLFSMVVVAAVAVLVTYLLMGGLAGHQAQPRKIISAPAPNPSVVSPETIPAPVQQTPLPAASPAIALPNLPVKQTAPVVVKAASPATIASKADARPVVPTKTPSGASISQREEATVPTEAMPPQMVPPSSPVKAQGAPVPPGINVSGIAWQREDSSNVAMVNGHPVVKGGVVDGFRVDDIFRDRVRFSREGKTFEIFIGETKGSEK